ncbi:hypothetical protein A8L34_27790 [Bacillus sp. FJAT-27264]|uniref:hypothetical protein n=1 Tax=Paenibacillus sp. (strain DSM 101736 / FJAT-27264) TaxID=1850362 RepID=UPI000807AE0F|nr:hypothetical protein [Bacillus sp. FJAT-27264]OBZ15852.1 hypothetical protein A8L34_27790 [Bacillus sp. FJAT-27264]
MISENGGKGDGFNLFPEPTEEMKEHMKKFRLMSNQHRLNDDKTDLKPSAIITQSVKDFGLDEKELVQFRNLFGGQGSPET